MIDYKHELVGKRVVIIKTAVTNFQKTIPRGERGKVIRVFYTDEETKEVVWVGIRSDGEKQDSGTKVRWVPPSSIEVIP